MTIKDFVVKNGITTPAAKVTGLSSAGYVTNTAAGVLGTVATIPNAGLTNSAVTIGSTPISLGSTVTSFAGLVNLTGSGTVDFAKFLGNAADTVTEPSFSWTGDTNTGIYHPAADQVAVTTGGSQRLLINSTGLTVTGDVKVSTADTATTATHYFVETGTDGFIRPKLLSNVRAEVVIASDILTKLLTVDGATSGLDADLLDGQHGSYYATDSTVVHTAGTETITGAKTFSTNNVTLSGVDLLMGNTLGDRITLYGTHDSATSYAIGIESNTLYYKANDHHRWYVGAAADAGVSDKMQLSSTTLNVNVPIEATSLTLSGDLTVNGTTTTVNTANLLVEDKNIELGTVAVPSDTTADGGGITLRGTTDKTWNWVNATDAWTSNQHIDLASTFEYKINNASVLSATTLGSGVVSSSLTSVGTLVNLTVTNTITGTIQKSQNLTGGNSTTLLGSIPYQSNTNTTTLLSPNTTTTKKFLRQTGTGTNGAAPAWDTIVNADIPNDLTGKTYNGLTLTAAAVGFTIAGGTTSKTLTVNDTLTLAGTGTLNISTGGTLGTAAFTASTAYATSGHTHNYAGSASAGGAASSVANSLIVKFDGLAVEGTSLYTFNGSAAKTIDFIAGTNVTITKAAGSATFSVPNALQWDGGSGGLNAANGRTNLGATTVGSSLFTLANPGTGGTVRFLKITDNVASARTAAEMVADIGALSASTSSTQAGYFGDIYLWDDSTPSHYLQITNSANLTAARSLSINVLDANRSLTLNGDLTVTGVVSVSGTNTGDQSITLTGDVTTAAMTNGSYAATVVDDSHNHTGLTISGLSAGDITTGILPVAVGGTGTTTSTGTGNVVLSTSPTLTGTLTAATANFSGTVTAPTFVGVLNSNNRTNWGGTGAIDNVVGMLAWKNYGSGHVIFDASNGVSPSGSYINNTNSAYAWSASYPTLMGWNGTGTYGVRVDSARVADRLGNKKILSGQSNTGATGIIEIMFPESFEAIPVVTVSSIQNWAIEAYALTIDSITQTHLTVRSRKNGSTTLYANANFTWIAHGV